MKLLAIYIMMMVAVSTAAAYQYPPQKMRPYAGIGVLFLPLNNTGDGPLPLYDEPGLSRQGFLSRDQIPSFDWIFGTSPRVLPLFVMARKGDWLRVTYDDAGREAWLNPPRDVTYQAWDLFYKGHVSRLLPGLQKKQYQLYQQQGTAPLMTLTTKQPFKVLQLDNDWAMVLLIEQNSLGWLRWRDEDGRLLIGIVTKSEVRQP
ncbi:MAG: hypothetical protein M0T70_00430 [Geobacteraceae bacterium]|nr:hypothetical protein [Geobacteraceae bacterium]